MKLCLTVFLAIVATMMMVPLSANESAPIKARVYGYALEYRLQENGTEQYNKLFNVLFRRALPFDLVVQPMVRITRDISIHSHCVFPASINAITTFKPEYHELKLIESDPIDHISLRVFSRSDKPVFTKLEQLNGKRLAIWGGLDENVFLKDIQAHVETTPSELVRVKMLDKGRIDAILGFTPDVVLAAEKLGLPLPHFSESLALFRSEGASMICHDTPANRVFIEKFNQEIKELKASGELQKILGPHVELAP